MSSSAQLFSNVYMCFMALGFGLYLAYQTIFEGPLSQTASSHSTSSSLSSSAAATSKRFSSQMAILANLMTASSFISATLAAMSTFTDGTTEELCHWSIRIGSAFYILTKMILYLILLVRGRVVKTASSPTNSTAAALMSNFSIKGKSLSAKLELLILWCTVLGVPAIIVTDLVVTHGQQMEDWGWVDHCSVAVPVELSYLMLALDAGLSFGYVFVFTLALREAQASLDVFKRKKLARVAAATAELPNSPEGGQKYLAPPKQAFAVDSPTAPSSSPSAPSPVPASTVAAAETAQKKEPSPDDARASIYEKLMAKHLRLTCVAVGVSVISMVIVSLGHDFYWARVLFPPFFTVDLSVNLFVVRDMTRPKRANAHKNDDTASPMQAKPTMKLKSPKQPGRDIQQEVVSVSPAQSNTTVAGRVTSNSHHRKSVDLPGHVAVAASEPIGDVVAVSPEVAQANASVPVAVPLNATADPAAAASSPTAISPVAPSEQATLNST